MKLTVSVALASLCYFGMSDAMFGRAQEASCPPLGLDTVGAFEIEPFISARWYVHEQTVTANTPIENFYCSYAEYELKPEPSDSGYTVDVFNYAQDSSGNEFSANLCAAQTGSGAGTDASKLSVSPCFLPLESAGPYWVMYYNEEDGVAIISGGSPNVDGVNGTCKTEDRDGFAGLWIFLRSANRNEEKIDGAKDFLRSLNYDLSVLNTVNQIDCIYDSIPEETNSCPPPGLDTVDSFDIERFISARWYVHEQTVTLNTPIENFYCSYAEYAIKTEPSDFDYTVDVFNYAQDTSGNEFGGNLCAAQTESGAGTDASKLAVAPCFLPQEAAGPYWVIYYNEEEGVAIISGGSPDVDGVNGTCKTQDKDGFSGLWIFLRSASRDEGKIDGAKDFLTSLNYDISVLDTVNQIGCVYDSIPEETNPCKDGDSDLHFFWSVYTCDTLPWFGCWFWAHECPKTCHLCEG